MISTLTRIHAFTAHISCISPRFAKLTSLGFPIYTVPRVTLPGEDANGIGDVPLGVVVRGYLEGTYSQLGVGADATEANTFAADRQIESGISRL